MFSPPGPERAHVDIEDAGVGGSNRVCNPGGRQGRYFAAERDWGQGEAELLVTESSGGLRPGGGLGAPDRLPRTNSAPGKPGGPRRAWLQELNGKAIHTTKMTPLLI